MASKGMKGKTKTNKRREEEEGISDHERFAMVQRRDDDACGFFLLANS